MNIVNRVKNILTKPKEEWKVIEIETTAGPTLAMNYLLPLAIVAAIATFIGFEIVIDFNIIKWGLLVALVVLLQLVIAAYVAGYVTDALAPSFGSPKNLTKSLQLVIYASTPFCLGHIFNLIPSINWLGLIAGGIYSLYLLFLGLPSMKKTPEDKVPIYLIVIILVFAVVYWLVGYICARLILSSMFGPFGGYYY